MGNLQRKSRLLYCNKKVKKKYKLRLQKRMLEKKILMVQKLRKIKDFIECEFDLLGKIYEVL